jgi:hypothetical protein
MRDDELYAGVPITTSAVSKVATAVGTWYLGRGPAISVPRSGDLIWREVRNRDREAEVEGCQPRRVEK